MNISLRFSSRTGLYVICDEQGEAGSAPSAVAFSAKAQLADPELASLTRALFTWSRPAKEGRVASGDIAIELYKQIKSRVQELEKCRTSTNQTDVPSNPTSDSSNEPSVDLPPKIEMEC